MKPEEKTTRVVSPIEDLYKKVDALNKRIDEFEHVKIQVKTVRPGILLPEYKTVLSAGMDLRAWPEKPVVLYPGEHRLFATGICIALPPGFEAQVRPRSGLAVKNGITVLNTPGTIDADYRGEIHVDLENRGHEPFEVASGMRIAQLVIARYVHCEFEKVDELDETDRADQGFGSTGIY